jgi:ABC-2 type transport system ATP-binding protein
MRVDYGDFVAVHGLSLTVPRGEVYGLVGPNGAGKTSSFKVLATLMQPTYGDVFIGGVDVALKPEAARKHLGYMPDLAPVPSDLKVWEFLDLFAAAHGISSSTRPARIATCLDKVNLRDKRDAFCKDLSRGMMQRLVLAKTILHEPGLYLLDEPASGMDPVSRAALRDTLRELARAGSAVLVSSHILSELEDMCTMVGFMSEGRLVDSGRIGEVVDRLSPDNKTLIATVEGAPSLLAEFLDRHEHATPGEAHGSALEFAFHGDDDAQVALIADIVAAGIRLKTFEERKASIERVLLDIDSKNGGSKSE